MPLVATGEGATEMGRRLSNGLLAMLVGSMWLATAGPANAQLPDWESQPVRPRIDVIPPLGNYLPWSYSARLNRPPYLAGKIAYSIEPASREAMTWQRAKQRGYYKDHAPRIVTHYLYSKPWEVLGTGPRPRPDAEHSPGERSQPTLVQLASPWEVAAEQADSNQTHSGQADFQQEGSGEPALADESSDGNLDGGLSESLPASELRLAPIFDLTTR